MVLGTMLFSKHWRVSSVLLLFLFLAVLGGPVSHKKELSAEEEEKVQQLTVILIFPSYKTFSP